MSKKRRTKYQSHKSYCDGYKFDSTKEMGRYDLLVGMQNDGAISDLKLQVSIEIQPHFRDRQGKMIRAIEYRADFSYIEDGELIIEDVKSKVTANKETYKLKKKLLAYKGIYIREYM